MLPSKKSIRKMRTQPFPGWVLSFIKNADNYCGNLIMFSIKIIEHKKYLVGKGINSDGEFLSVISKEGDILTLLENGRWSVACINQQISSNATVFNGACVYKFFNDDKEGRSAYNTLCSHILSRKEKLKITHMAENQRAKNEMWECVPKAPHEFISFCYDDYGYKLVFSTKDRKTGFCGKCLKKITFQKNLVSRHNYKCPYCHKNLTAVSYKQLSSRRIFKCYSMLDIYDDDRLIVRHFDASEAIRVKVESDCITEIKVERSIDEYERDLFEQNRSSFSYHIRKYDYTTGVLFWQNSKPSEGWHLVGTLPNRYYESEKIYKGNFEYIAQKVSGVSDVIDSISHCISNGVVDSQRLEELILGNKNTILAEKLEKIGLRNLSSHVIFQSIHRGFYYDAKFNESLPYTVKEFIKCNKRFVKFAVENNIDYPTLRCMQHFNEKFTDKFEDFIIAYNYCKSKTGENIPNLINSIVDFCVTYKVTVRQVVSYLEKQSGSIIDLQDYVSMYLEAYSLSHNTTYSVLEYSKHFLFPQNLMQSHDDALQWLNSEKDKREKKEIIEKNKMLLSIIAPLQKLDGKDIGNYKFSFPHSKSDFVHQGELMHICVGKFNYFDKMCEGKNYICFVAKANKPYATVEFKKEENNQLSLVQARAYGNGAVTSDCTEQINKFKNLLEATVLSNLSKK